MVAEATAKDSHPVNDDVKTQPNNVNKVPIPSRTLKTKMLVGIEMPFLQAKRDDQQHQHAQKHVEAVETREHVKGRSVRT